MKYSLPKSFFIFILFGTLSACGTTGPENNDPPPGFSTLANYTNTIPMTTLSYVPADLSGITYNPDSDTFYLIRNNGSIIWEVDTSYNLIRTIRNVSIFGDSEDIVYLRNDEYAIVSEEGVLYIGIIPSGTTDIVIDPADFQKVTFAADAGNSGPEGVAFDITTQTFYIVKEENPRKLYSFVRPVGSADITVTPTEPFDAQTVPSPRLTQDMSAVLFNPYTGRLLILSDSDSRVIDIALDGTVYGVLDFPNAQHEGITFDSLGNLHIVGEQNFYHVYSAL